MASIFRKSSLCSIVRVAFVVTVFSGLLFAQNSRWTADKAKSWYDQQPWLVGSNYIPSDAINQLEMWQAQSFDAAQIDKELGWAEDMGMNTMRVFLHDLLWQEDAAGFKKRMDQFLQISSRHHIKPLFVLFDSCWNQDPKLGVQHKSNNTNTGLMWCREEICRNWSMRFLKPAASSCHSRSCRKTRMVFIPMSSAHPSSLSICAASKLCACHISSWLIASEGM